ncbi:hypothetical protein, partial [Acidianus sp. RZ1]
LNDEAKIIDFIAIMKKKNKKDIKISSETTQKYISIDSLLALELLKMDSNVNKIYTILNNSGLFSGRKIKMRVAISFYLAGYRRNKLDSILEKLNINHKYLKKVIYKLPKEIRIDIQRVISKAN